MAARLQEYYETNLVDKTWILCIDDLSATKLSNELIELDFPVSLITMDMLQEDRAIYSHDILDFKHRVADVIIIPYPVYISLREMMEVHIYPYCSLIGVYGLDDDTWGYIGRLLENAERRGFFPQGAPPLYALDLPEENIEAMDR